MTSTALRMSARRRPLILSWLWGRERMPNNPRHYFDVVQRCWRPLGVLGLELILPGWIECPRWDDAYRAGIGDLLTEVLCDVLNDIEQDAPFGNLPSVPL